MICKACGTLYNSKEGPCPKCATSGMDAQVQDEPPAEMSAEESKKLRTRAWIELVIGVPAFIGFIYLLVYLFKLIKG